MAVPLDDLELLFIGTVQQPHHLKMALKQANCTTKTRVVPFEALVALRLVDLRSPRVENARVENASKS